MSRLSYSSLAGYEVSYFSTHACSTGSRSRSTHKPDGSMYLCLRLARNALSSGCGSSRGILAHGIPSGCHSQRRPFLGFEFGNIIHGLFFYRWLPCHVDADGVLQTVNVQLVAAISRHIRFASRRQTHVCRINRDLCSYSQRARLSYLD